MMPAFTPSTTVIGRPQSLLRQHRATTCNQQVQCGTPTSMQLQAGSVSLYGGAGILAAVLANRLLLTPLDSLAMTQSRSDILGVIAGATLVLYGVGKAEIAERKEAVEMGGLDVRQGFEANDRVSREVQWASSAIFEGVPNVRSFAIVIDGIGQYFIGRFRNELVEATVVESGTVARAMASGQRVYLADMKVVPVKELEFGFLPSNCQAVIVQPVSSRAAIILGADKTRPFTGPDFGWLQAISDRLQDVLEAEL